MTEIDRWIGQIKAGKYLEQRQVRRLCNKVKEVFFQQSNIQQIQSPITICGDIHGQFFDLLQLFKVGGDLPQNKYIFLGDFVDRGYNSVQTIQLLFCYKLKYPKDILLLRGNHQSRNVTTVYGFYDQIIKKYGCSTPWKYFNDAFDYLPLGALIDGKNLCIHGGLSPQLKTIDQMRAIDRKMEIPQTGPFCDLMWSDPQNVQVWQLNNRGAGYIFGQKIVRDFNHINGLQLIARSHQLVQQGFQFWFTPRNLVTVWSAPNYCYRCGNVGSILKINERQPKQFCIFQTVPQSMKSQNYKTILPYFL